MVMRAIAIIARQRVATDRIHLRRPSGHHFLAPGPRGVEPERLASFDVLGSRSAMPLPIRSAVAVQRPVLEITRQSRDYYREVLLAEVPRKDWIVSSKTS
ncbi:hypothetical protein MRX96_003915 [Rhipicephalus microplus]